jgi:uncharacterized protein (DUF1800 family)
MDTRAAHALIRFGLGRRGEEPLPSNPVAWLHAQLQAPDATPAGASVAEGLAALKAQRDARGRPDRPKLVEPIVKAEMAAFTTQALTTASPFRERLVWFWANHFTISLRGGTASVAGAFVRDAIRPHVTGRFGEMLLAVMRHPAMLMYLDNAQSAGPGSIAGQQNHRGLNENLARECMELHTVSPAAGYAQADVTSFAKIITGWSVELKQEPLGFKFRPNLHEPGPKTLMGRSFAEGEQGGADALAFLAAHEATHRHLAAKLVRHFAADDPPPSAVRRVAAVLHDTGGDLGQAAAALIGLDACWTPLAKLRSPQDYVVAVFRASGVALDDPAPATNAIGVLGQPLWKAPFPIGWPDRAADWAGPEAMLRRVDWSYSACARFFANVDAVDAAGAALGPLLSAGTGEQIRRAGSRRDALTLLFASPEFQRR